MPLPIYNEHTHTKSKKSVGSSNTQEANGMSKIGAVIGVAAGKGGVGKSSVTVNLAHAMKLQGLKVGILDADIYGPSMRRMLPEDRLPSQKGNVIEPALCNGIKMISMAYFRKENEATAVRAPIANGLISHFIKNILWGELDVLLIDFPPGTGDIQLTLSQQARLTGAIMVTTPQEVALIDVRKAISLFDQVKIPLIGIVENMSYFQQSDCEERIYPFGKGGGERLALQAGALFLGHIPLDPLICTGGDAGKSLFDLDLEQRKPATKAFIKVASEVIEQINFFKIESQQGIGEFKLLWKQM